MSYDYDRKTASTSLSLNDFFEEFFTEVAKGLQREFDSKHDKLRFRRKGFAITVEIIVGEDDSAFNLKVSCELDPYGVAFKVEQFENLKYKSLGSGTFSMGHSPSEAAQAIVGSVHSAAYEY